MGELNLPVESAPAVAEVPQQTNIADINWENVEILAPKLAPESAPTEEVKPENGKNEEIKPETETKSEELDKNEPKVDSLKDDLELEIKIDGKLEKVSLKDLKANYSGKVAYDKKFSEIDKTQKAVVKEKAVLQKEIDQVNSYVNEFASKMKAKDPVGAMAYLAQFSGLSPAQMKHNLIQQLLPEINRLSDLTPEARDLELNKEELNFQKNRQEMELKKLHAENSKKESELANYKLRSEKGISENEWETAFEFLDTHLEPGKPITRNDVAEYAIWKRADNRATGVLSSFDGGNYSKDNVMRDTLTRIVSENPDFSEQDLNDILNDSLKVKVKEEVKKVAEQKNVQSRPRDEKGKFTYTSQALTSWD